MHNGHFFVVGIITNIFFFNPEEICDTQNSPPTNCRRKWLTADFTGTEADLSLRKFIENLDLHELYSVRHGRRSSRNDHNISRKKKKKI